MKTIKGLSRKEFDNNFGTNLECMTHLYNQKWGNGFTCRNCGCHAAYKGRKQFYKRCKACGKEESATAHTLFHNVKFDLYKAFGMVYDILLSKKGANSMWLAERYEVSQNTAWLFRRKLQQYLKSSGKNPLTGTVHVDEFEIGTPKTGKQGRARNSGKIRVVMALEIRERKVGNAYASVIQNFSTKALKPLFNAHVSTSAEVKTDGWSGYTPLKRIYKRLIQENSEKGSNFPQIHIQFRNFKNWLRGVHSYCSAENMQDYIDEYLYRFNRKAYRQSILENLWEKLISKPALTYQQIKSIAN